MLTYAPWRAETKDRAIQADLIIKNGHIVTLDEARRVLPDGALAVTDRRIVAVGPEREVLREYGAQRTIDARGGVVHPGFVDCHSHTTYHLLRGAIDETASYAEALPPYISYLNEVDDDAEHASALLACVEMLSNGTTCFLEAGTAHSPAAVAAAAEAAGIRGLVGDPFVADTGIPAELALDRAPPTKRRALQVLGTELKRNNDPDALVRGHVVLQGMGSASDELELAAKSLADNEGTILNQHQSYSADDVAVDDRRYGRHPMVHLADLGILDRNSVFAHVNILRQDELSPVAQSGMSIAWCPTASMMWGVGGTFHGHHIELHRRGVNVALGSDSSNWSNRFDLGAQGYLALLTAREKTGDRSQLVAKDVLEIASLNGARAVGLEAEIGSLEPGKRADIVIRSNDIPEAFPLTDPIAQTVYSSRSKSVLTVLVDGQIVVENRRPTKVDLNDLFADVQTSTKRVFERMGYHLPRT